MDRKNTEMFPFTIAFHQIRWGGGGNAPLSMKAGGNINYHMLNPMGTTEHGHEIPEIILVLGGRIRHFVNGETFALEAGALVFVRPSDRHLFQPLENESCELVTFSFQLELFLDLSSYLGNDFFLKRFTAPVTPPTFTLTSAEAEKLGARLLRINTEQTSSLEVAKIKAKAVLAELFINYFLETQEGYLKGAGIPPWLESLCLEMRKPENIREGLKAMQRLAPCTPEHLCKAFRKHFKRTPTEHVNELKVNHAAKMLSDTDEKIFSISSDLGFLSLSRFYKLFRNYYGMSPAKFRSRSRRPLAF